MLALECIVNQYARTSSTLCNEINTMERNNYYQVYVAKQGNSNFYFFYDGSNYYVLTKKDGYSIAHYHGYTNNVWTYVDNILPYLYEKDTWDDFGCGRYSSNGLLYTRKQRKMFQELFTSDFEDFKQKAPAEYKKNSSEILMMKKRNESLCKEWDEAKLLLQKLYQVNIIPESFRND